MRGSRLLAKLLANYNRLLVTLKTPTHRSPITVKVHEAKTTLSKLIVRVLEGDRVVIARDETPVVELVPVHPSQEGAGRGRQFGALRGVVAITSAFFESLPPEEIAEWES